MFCTLKKNRDRFGTPVRYRSAFDAGLVRMQSPIFYLPFDSAVTTAPTGQTLDISGNITYGTFGGKQCCLLSGDASIRSTTNSNIVGSASRSISFWGSPLGGSNYVNAVGLGNQARLFNCGLRLDGGGIYVQFTTWGNDINDWRIADDGKLHHYCYVFDNANVNELIIYVDGVAKKYTVSGIDTTNAPFVIGQSGDGGWGYYGYLAGVRYFDFALTAEQCQILKDEL